MSASANSAVTHDRGVYRPIEAGAALAGAPDVGISAAGWQRRTDGQSSHVVRIDDCATADELNALAMHPLQSWEWGAFRQQTGVEVVRLGRYGRGHLLEAAQLLIHRLPRTPFTVGYLPRSGNLSHEMLHELKRVGKRHRCVFIKLEPNISGPAAQLAIPGSQFDVVTSPHPFFPKHTFQLDLTATEEQLLKRMHPKTRYNIKVAQKHTVQVREDNSQAAFDSYLQLLSETTKRQMFHAHDERYHRLLWETLAPRGIAHLLTATLDHGGKSHILAAWMLFLFKDALYYPYGASTHDFKHVMASNLLMWEAIKFGKRNGATMLDMWGCLGPEADPSHPWFGFHRFKEGYNPTPVEFVGSFDLVIHPTLYRVYNRVYSLRKAMLKVKLPRS